MDPQYDDASRPLADTQQPWNILNFYATPAKNDPWVPRGVIQTGHQSTDALPSPRHLVPQTKFLDFESTTSPSDCATLPGDSGYGSSRQAYSTASASVHGGDDLALDSHMGQVMSECRINPEAAPAEPPTRLAASGKYRCDECKAFVRSQGELKKHKQRHLKSHKCPYAGCIKGQRGFSTSNDLVRHKRSVHGEHGTTGPKVWPRADNFRSHLLRSHHVKLNSDDDHKEYIYQPSARRHDLKGVGDSLEYVDSETRPMCLHDSPVLSGGQQSGAEPHFPESQFAHAHEMMVESIGIDPAIFNPSPMNAGQTSATAPSSTGGETPYIHPGILSRPVGSIDAMGDSATTFTMQHQSDYTLNHPSFSHQPFSYDEDDDSGPSLSASTPRDITPVVHPPAAAGRESWKRDSSAFSESTPEGLDDFGADTASTRQCRRVPYSRLSLGILRESIANVKSDRSEIVNYLKRFPKEFLQSALRGEDGQDTEPESPSEDESNPRIQLGCPDPYCDKNFSRPCELKKHMKRHEKPYGCTFKSCSKRFGSKNDWKRHESSQHFMLEKWDCDEPNCTKICQRRESFKNHLQKDHDMNDAELIDDKLESCRLGRHCDPRFWCGFCVRVIQIDVNERGGNSWTKRCDHIDNHLFGKEGLQKKVMKEWKHQEDQQRDTELASEGMSTDASGVLSRNPIRVGGVEAHERKRRSSSETSFRPRKKASRTQTYMWICCMCFTTMNLKTSSCCFECHHARCLANCAIESVSAQENDENWDEEMQAMTLPMELDTADTSRQLKLQEEAQ
ncbi:C2H2 type zinc finger domain protein [Hirsutella rhossiliensis]|uniref:C2H2 type zinc finger domain protein n=1 Tax=Hirsutella rhossiliensis TaxID=111463 RepID=A0A9P8MZF1_9HYPO|nr:C2H2 type zinc finger domain protein [Hirsutella rhossiliensis]KAH0961932.1 C2H2 type zinc finger domain protein [Hirsutella rhossiliensis]